jgi:hypothetical protein
VKDAFRRGLGYAVQWHNNLQWLLQQRVDIAIEMSDTYLQTVHKEQDAPPSPQSGQQRPGQCARILQQRCPACFGGDLFGRPLTE